MGDVHIPKEDPTTSQRIGAKVESLIASGHELYAETLTGQKQGRTRRPTLFIIAAIGTGLAVQFPVGALIALTAILLLALTDNVL